MRLGQSDVVRHHARSDASGDFVRNVLNSPVLAFGYIRRLRGQPGLRTELAWFPKVAGVAQQGLARFAISSVAPNKRGPVDSGANLVPTLSTPSHCTVPVSWKADWNRDNELLTYKVVRNGNNAAPVFQTNVRSTWWNRPTLTFNDTSVTGGQAYRYRLYVTDPFDNTVSGQEVSITAA
jgi:hypothetical protein